MSTQSTLALPDARRFEALDDCVVKGVKTFVEVGKALAEIRERKLYQQGFGTFEDYCSARGIERRRAYQLMEAADVADDVQKITHAEPNESQARALAPLPTDERPAAWREAVETAPNGKVTAAHVESVVQRVAPKPAPAEQPKILYNHPEPQEWNGRTIPANVPPLNVDEKVNNAPGVRWARLIRDIQSCIVRLPDKQTLNDLPKPERRDIVDRFRTFAKQLQEAV